MTLTEKLLAASLAAGLAAAVSTSTAHANGVGGAAGPAIDAYMRATKIPCYNSVGESRCPIASLNQGVRTFYDRQGTQARTALAFINYQYDSTGNAMDQMAILLRKDDRWVIVGRADNTIGSSPRQVVLIPGGAITYVGTVVGPGDSRSDPHGQAKFCLSYTNDSLVTADRVKCKGRPGEMAPIPMVETR